jgi:GT2 family glycosyltransferase
MTELLFSVVIPTYQRLDLLSACLERLKPDIQSLESQSYEVIVTDDGQSIVAEDMIAKQYPWVRWVQGPRRGPAANRNHGASQARGKWIILTDDDCLPEPDWLAAFQRAQVNHAEVFVFEGRVFTDRPRRSLDEISPINDKGGNLWSCNVCILRSLFQELGGFDERFPYAAMEDVELRIRLEKRGQKIVFLSEAGICHPWRKASGWKGWMKYRDSVAVFLTLHPEQRQKLTSMYYLQVMMQTLIKETLPGLVYFRGAGASQSLVTVLFFGSMAFRAALQPSWYKKVVQA